MNEKRLVDYDCYLCDTCRTHVYDESIGEPSKGIAAKTLVENLPLSWRCPVCGASKDRLRASTLLDYFFDEIATPSRKSKAEAIDSVRFAHSQ